MMSTFSEIQVAGLQRIANRKRECDLPQPTIEICRVADHRTPQRRCKQNRYIDRELGDLAGVQLARELDRDKERLSSRAAFERQRQKRWQEAFQMGVPRPEFVEVTTVSKLLKLSTTQSR